MASKPITYENFISIDGAEPVPMDSLSEEEKKRCRKIMAERIGKAMSEYYTQHPDEFLKLD